MAYQILFPVMACIGHIPVFQYLFDHVTCLNLALVLSRAVHRPFMGI